MSRWFLVAAGTCALLVVVYFAFVILRLAHDRDADREYSSYADRPWGVPDPAIPLPYVILFIVLGLVGAGLLVRAAGAFQTPLTPRAYPTLLPYETPPSFDQPEVTPVVSVP